MSNDDVFEMAERGIGQDEHATFWVGISQAFQLACACLGIAYPPFFCHDIDQIRLRWNGRRRTYHINRSFVLGWGGGNHGVVRYPLKCPRNMMIWHPWRRASTFTLSADRAGQRRRQRTRGGRPEQCRPTQYTAQKVVGARGNLWMNAEPEDIYVIAPAKTGRCALAPTAT
jgi:hypothetical protein